ncbi:MAG: hypothetical protein ACRCVJ_09455 [Clostridium sp.]|uniref:hypothetical protein n=1 Tax=Clostridium sp. TaxID=1506 RepID=UPI003F3EB26F
MKLLVWYVEKCKVDKGFRLKSSLLVGLIGAIIAIIINMTSGLPLDVSIVSGLILGAFWIPMWFLLIRQTIKFRDKRKKQEELEAERERAEKRKRTEERQKNRKKNNKKR